MSDNTEDTGTGHDPTPGNQDGRPLAIGAMLRRDVAPHELRERARSLDGAFEELWIVEDLPYAGGIAQLAEVLASTTQAKVGHGIAPTPFRNPALLAMEWAAVAGFHPGRLIAGVGHGVQEWMAQVGAAVESPMTLMRETVTVVRDLLHGNEVDMDGRYVTMNRVALNFPPSPVPPVLAGVTGPKSLRLSGALADGTILPEGHGPDQVVSARVEIDRGRAEDGRTDHHHLTVFAAFMVGTEDDSPPPDGTGPSWLAIAPGSEQVTDKLDELVKAGVDSLVLVPMGPNPHYQLDVAASQIVPELRDRADRSGRAVRRRRR